jgi:hypothetical protein
MAGTIWWRLCTGSRRVKRLLQKADSQVSIIFVFPETSMVPFTLLRATTSQRLSLKKWEGKIKLPFLFAFILFATCPAVNAQRINLIGPAGSGQFGIAVTVLTNGNYVVTDPSYDNGAIVNVGAVYLYNGQTQALISTLTGSKTNDQVGNFGIIVLNNGNFVVRSSVWDNGAIGDAGAVTWVNGATGLNGAVSSVNSLVGGTASDGIGSNVITALSNGNYVVNSINWDNGAVTNAGAVTWGNGTTGIAGVISSSNSLVGSRPNDNVGIFPITVLSNGNYVVRSTNWDNGAVVDAGAVTWGNGTTGITGVISSSNSLVGSTATDQVGSLGVTTLSNGNYVVNSPNWDNGAIINVGAVTWGNGISGTTGVVSSSNSLVGNKTNDVIANFGIITLSNGNYLVSSTGWDNGAVGNAGALTWGNGTTGITGVVSSSNSLVGSTANDQIGNTGITALGNGNYVVKSVNWDNGAAADAGAVTWGNGTTGTTGVVSSSNSLVGGTGSDAIGSGSVTALSNGNYVVSSPNWRNGAVIGAGAVTWGNGTSGISGLVSSSNSLVGTTASDLIGTWGITALTNGNYVVSSANWNNGAVLDAGAVTWGNGTTGITGVVSSSNSLVGSNAFDNLGSSGVTTLSNGNYVVISISWNNGFGAVTWGNGTTGITGVVSSSNSLVGNTASDLVGNGGITVLSNGNYVVRW